MDLGVEIALWIGFWLAVIFLVTKRMSERKSSMPADLPNEINTRSPTSFKETSEKLVEHQQPHHSEAGDEQG